MALKRSDIVEVFVVKDALEGEQLKIIAMHGGNDRETGNWPSPME